MYQKKALFALLAVALPVRSAVQFQTPARFHQLLKKEIPGALLVDNDGISFQSDKFSKRWVYGEIKTFDLVEIFPAACITLR